MRCVLCLVVLACLASSSRASSLNALFNRIDENRNGLISVAEFGSFYCASAANAKCQSPAGRARALQQVEGRLKQLDTDRSGQLSFAEFAPDQVADPVLPGPQQVHLAVTQDPTEMVVMWVTRDVTKTTTVRYGTKSGVYGSSAAGTYDTYNAGVFGWKGWVHTVSLSGLQTSTRYFYQAGTDGDWSQEFSFVTGSATPNPSDTLTYAVVADMGTRIPMGYAVTNQIIADTKKEQYALVIHAGDVCYAGTGSTDEFEEIWDVWGDQVQDLAANVPYMFAPGNHEHYYNWSSYMTRFRMPSEQCGGFGNFWYSIDYGTTHFVFFSTEHPYDVGSPQRTWLDQDLTKAVANRAQRPWIIAVGHRPMYNSDTDEWGAHSPGSTIQVELDPVFKNYGIDLYINGHMHMYERVHPVFNGTVAQTGNDYVNPGATAHVTQATAGVFQDSSFVNPQPAWSANRNNRFGYGKMTINGTHLHYTYLHQDDGSVLDEFSIEKW
eukprot:TRINITY_DN2134_c0_g1_i1.p2 TRINITY_DN2134_c0_g1~~TRINITY_DN2134_c0_g1_i1.p2  ORF type:complete len:528 (-),score=174.99 TRINITY_DN2134_c0_g1_i1:190-1668(-)